MKHFYFIMALIFCVAFTASAQWKSYKGSKSKTVAANLIEEGPNGTVIEILVPGYYYNTVEIMGEKYSKLSIPKTPIFLEKGYPELPRFNRSIVIPNTAKMNFEILKAEYDTIRVEPVAPSKGSLPRSIDPKTVPYTFNEYYKTDAWWPEKIIELSDPFIMRDVRGITVRFNMFRFNPVKKQLIICTRFVVRVFEEGAGEINIKENSRRKIDADFSKIYSRFFLNYSEARSGSLQKTSYTGVGETGRMLVIAADDFYDTMIPFRDWRTRMGYKTSLVKCSDVGTSKSAVQDYIQDMYDENESVTYILLVGDLSDESSNIPSKEIPTYGNTGVAHDSPKDPKYTLLEGGDDYPDAYIARLSVETVSQVKNQVNRIINYETNPLSGSWFKKATGIASHQGNPADSTRCNWLRDDLLGYEYTSVDKLYDITSSTPITNALNAGRGVVNFIGHGIETEWGFMAPYVWPLFDVDDVDNLSNSNLLPFVFSVACQVGSFTDPRFSCCFSESWLRSGNSNNPKGAIAMYGSSINQPWVEPCVAQAEAVDLLVADSKLTIGGLCFNGSSKMIEDYPNSGPGVFDTWHIFGDAASSLWTDTPQYFTNIQITDNSGSITVNAGTTGCDICLSSFNNGDNYHEVETNTSSHTFTGISSSDRPLYITVTKHNYIPYTAVTGGTFTTDQYWFGKLNVLDDITVASNVALTIEPGSSIKLVDDVTFYIEGTLNALGISTNPITFTRSGTSAWDRIRLNGGNNVFEWCVFDGGTCNVDIRSSNNSFSNCTSMNAHCGIYFYIGSTGTVSNSEINNNYYGVYLYKSKPTIQDCEINDCSTGIYLSDNNYISSDADIINNSIYDNTNYGIFCYKSSPEIRENIIESNYKGVYCTNSSSPLFGAYNTRGNNIISGCYIGLSANYDSDPALYLSYPRLGGWNQFISMNYFIRAYNYSNVYAENNWWGSSPPDHSKFSAYYNSSIYYDPWLTSDPSDPPPPESSSPNSALSSYDYNSGYDENWSLKRKIDYARSLIYLDNPAESKKICADIIDFYPDSSLSFLALNVYWAADRYQSEKEKTGQKDFQDLLINLSAKKYKCELYGYSELLLADFEGDKGLSRIDKVYNEYKDSFLPEAALYQKFLYYLDAKEDLSSAIAVNDQLNEEYPNSSFTKWSNEHLSNESSFNKNESLSDNDFNENQIPLEYNLFSNFPNPFNPSTCIKYALPKVSDIQIVIYNSIGQKIKSFEQIQQPRGVHFFRWDGKNDAGLKIPSGLYILRFNAVSLEEEKKVFNKSVKMLLIR